MALPGFEAEASLYETAGRYWNGALPRLNQAIYLASDSDFFDPVGDSIDYDDINRAPTYGTIKGSTMEDRFISCMKQCQAGHVTYANCNRSCCRQLTGFSNCLIA
jgi:hypothetical protein